MKYLRELSDCQLCEHRCGVNRLEGESGVCKMTVPMIASATLHPAPPQSYTIFMAGCNFKCLNCQNWSISQYPDNKMAVRGTEAPEVLAKEGINHLRSHIGHLMRADRIFFSGGEPTIHLPYIEEIINAARKVVPSIKVNFDTNGYMTEESLNRILNLTTSMTFDIKAYNDEVHKALTGAEVSPVLRNASYVGKHAKDKLWEYRILIIPHMNEGDIRPLSRFIVCIDPSLPVCFLAFRPNFILEEHSGATTDLMNKCVDIAKNEGLTNVYWSGRAGLSGRIAQVATNIVDKYHNVEARNLATQALKAGCSTHPRDCKICKVNQTCPVKRYIPRRST